MSADFSPREYASTPTEPWPHPVSAQDVLDDVLDQFYFYSHVKEFQITHVAAALWASGTWFCDYCNHFAMAIITAPEPECGKTTTLEIIGKVCKNPVQTANASASSIFRIMGERPTLLIDEVDQFLKSDPATIGILNSGTGINGKVLRCETDPKTKLITVYEYPTFGAKALCGISANGLPETITSRSIILELARKPKDRVIKDFYLVAENPNLHNDFVMVQRKLARLAIDLKEQFVDANPTTPKWLQNRNLLNWRPLLKLASLAGEEWLAAALVACEALTQTGKSSLGENLLRDIKSAFDSANIIGDDEIFSSAELIGKLTEDEFAGWSTYNRGSPITARQIGQQLRKHGIEPSRTMKLRGFKRAQFKEVWASYVD